MSFVVPEEISMLVTSDPSAGAKNISSDGSYFEISLEEPLKVPKDALNVNISVPEATIWWNIPNIKTGVNDKLYITAPNTVGTVVSMVVVIPQGLYDLSLLNDTITRELELAGAASSLISLTSDDATQKVGIIFKNANVSIDFNHNDTFRDILGYNATTYGPYTTVPYEKPAPNVAGFNQIESFLIHSDLTSRGILVNNRYTQTLTQVLIDKPPGHQLVSTPYNPPKLASQELSGAIRQSLRFWLTDFNNRPVNTNGEYWTCRVVISYLKPFVVQKT